jgi:hypothetical protein
MARKRKKPTRTRKAPPANGVVDIDVKRVEKLTEKICSLAQAITDQLDEQVAIIVGGYRNWQQAHPDLALKPRHKLAMVRLGFVGPGGFERCGEPGRLPEAAFLLEDGDVVEQIRRDRGASEVLMCPAMEEGVCQGVWRGMRMPPCYLLLLEVHHGLGGGAIDDVVQEVVDDFGLWGGPEQYAERFARGEQAVREAEKAGRSP